MRKPKSSGFNDQLPIANNRWVITHNHRGALCPKSRGVADLVKKQTEL
jgi:hypothetical protein